MRYSPLDPHDDGWCAWSVDSIFDEAEVLAGGQESAEGGHAPIPDRPGMFQYFGIWLPGTRWSGITGVFFAEAGQPMNTFSQIDSFDSAISLTVDGAEGMIRVQTNRQARENIGGTVYWDESAPPEADEVQPPTSRCWWEVVTITDRHDSAGLHHREVLCRRVIAEQMNRRAR